MPEPDLCQPITKVSGLKRLAHVLADQPVIAVDTESNSLFAYHEQVCLIQFSTPEEDYLVDPLALANLSALEPVFAETHIQKTFHAAEYDLICLKRDFGFSFSNIFDTMLAARILGRKEVGLGSMLEAEFNLHVDKRHQRANWGQRPLPDFLLDYARQDTHYLIPLKDKLERELKKKGFLPLAREDFQRVCRVEAGSENGRYDCWRVNGVHHLSPQQVAVLQELCVYRDEAARKCNRPLFKVISDHTLHAIASASPATIDDLKTLPGMTQHQVNRHGKAILQAVQRGLQAEPVYPPHNIRPDERYLARLEALKQWRKLKARQLEVESDIILPRDLLHELAAKNPQTLQALSSCLADVPWRRERYGEEIIKVLNKHH
ncbi:MAG TPA: HRDC domain-containing protein [Anaerolineales bacterium]|nr:HRDC domain-containing protein [Anaerolineales bacterium]